MRDSAIHQAWRGSERCRSCAIRHLVLFANLGEPDFERIHLPIEEIDVAAGDTLYRLGDTPPSVWTVRAGLIKLVQVLPNGDQRIVRLLRQGDVAGLERLLGGPLQHDAVALDGVQLCRIPIAVVETLGRDNPALYQTLVGLWQRALQEAELWITRLSTGQAKRRVARLLLYLSESCERPGFFLPTREDMGAMLGITTESASKAMADFRRRGLLQTGSDNRATIDAGGLTQIADQ